MGKLHTHVLFFSLDQYAMQYNLNRLFELFHETTNRALWKAKLAPGASVCIHTITLDDPLLLKITLRYCKTVEGILINRPRNKLNQTNITEKINKFMEVDLFDICCWQHFTSSLLFVS
jgi:hypothetical protein